MSLVPANIDVNFTAVYVGNHRVCYRVGGVGAYSCVTVNCAGNSTNCVASIPIFVDNETCPVISFDGYIQPTCIDIASTDERFPFSTTFTPSPTCKNYVATCVSSGVAFVNMVNKGTAYNPLSAPSVLFTGGGGTGATGTAVVGTGFILSPFGTITIAGSGYTNGTYSNVDITGGSGTGAKAQVVVAGGIVTSVAITTAGNGYLSANVLGLDYVDMGMGAPPAVSAAFTVTTDYGTVTSINVTAAGSGYTSTPTVTIGASAGVAATGTAVLAGCPSVTSYGCNGVAVVYPEDTFNVGDTVSICSITGTPVLNSVYSVVQSGNCLCSGVIATITATGTVGQQVRYFYNRINGGVITGLLTVGGSPSSIIDCVVPGSVKFQILGNATGNVTYGGAC